MVQKACKRGMNFCFTEQDKNFLSSHNVIQFIIKFSFNLSYISGYPIKTKTKKLSANMSSFNHLFHTFIYCLLQKLSEKFVQKLNFNITDRLFKLKFCTIGAFFA